MSSVPWSDNEKKVARAAFDLALSRERVSVRTEIESMLAESTDPLVVWDIHDYLSRKRKEIDGKYDYRYSQLDMVFGRLVYEGWLAEDELAGLKPERVGAIQRTIAFYREMASLKSQKLTHED